MVKRSDCRCERKDTEDAAWFVPEVWRIAPKTPDAVFFHAMTRPDTLHVHRLPAPQQRLWRELIEVPAQFTLYGGTAVALHLGNRESIDFDFFGIETFGPRVLPAKIGFLADAGSRRSNPIR